MTVARLALAAALIAAPVLAAGTLSGEAIRERVIGNTVTGSMSGSEQGYVEFYAEDGTIRGEGYTGAWRVEDDRMCFAYGEDPATCYAVAAEGEGLRWMREGETVGTGTIIEGNPRGL